MRHLSTAAPLLAALILAACSAEGGAPGEGTDTVVVGDVAGEDAAAPPSDVPPLAVDDEASPTPRPRRSFPPAFTANGMPTFPPAAPISAKRASASMRPA